MTGAQRCDQDSSSGGSRADSDREESFGSPHARIVSGSAAAAAARNRVAAALVEKQQCTAEFAARLDAHFSAFEGSEAAGAALAGRRGALLKGKTGFRGVTRHKRTQRFESHIWESKKQIYLGGFDSEALAAKAHDVMALRCKSGAGGAAPEAGEVLNFPRTDYETLLPIIDRLSREDVITALRNYSKAQTTRRLEEAGRPLPGRPRPTTTATRQASSRPRRQAGAPAGAGSGAAPIPLKLTVVVRPLARIADEAESMPAQLGAGLKRFGGKVAPRPLPRPRPDEDETEQEGAAAEACAPSPKKRRQNEASEATQPPTLPPASLREGLPGPTTPHAGGAADAGAPATPTAAAAQAAAAAAAATSAGSGGAQHSAGRMGGARWRTTSGGSRLGPAAGLELAVSTASAALGTEPAAQQVPPPASSRRPARRRRLTAAAAARAAVAAAAAAGQDAQMADAEADPGMAAAAAAETLVVEVVGPGSPHSPASPFDLEQAGSGFLPLLEEPSLTFSASDDAYLFSPLAPPPTAAPSCVTALEHVNGTVLYRQDELPGGSPSVGTAAEGEDCASAGSAPGDTCAAAVDPGTQPVGVHSTAGKPLPISPPRRVPVQAAHAVPSPVAQHAPSPWEQRSVSLPPGHPLCISSPFAAPAAAAALGLHQRCCSSLSGEERPVSPEELIYAPPAEVVPAPPPAVEAFGRLVAYCLPPPAAAAPQQLLHGVGPVAAASATAAMHHHRGILLHPQPSLYSAPSPFASGLFLG